MIRVTTGITARIAATAATVLFAVVVFLQLLLAVGILPVTMAWGGRQDELTLSLRFASVVAALVLASFAYVIRRRAGLVGSAPVPITIKVLSWIITGFLALNTLGNLASPSLGETLVFAPLTFLLVICCAAVSLSRSA